MASASQKKRARAAKARRIKIKLGITKPKSKLQRAEEALERAAWAAAEAPHWDQPKRTAWRIKKKPPK